MLLNCYAHERPNNILSWSLADEPVAADFAHFDSVQRLASSVRRRESICGEIIHRRRYVDAVPLLTMWGWLLGKCVY